MTATIRLQNDQNLIDMQRKKPKTDIFWRETDFEDIPFVFKVAKSKNVFSVWSHLQISFLQTQ